MGAARYRRLRSTLEKRQPDLTVLLEGVHKPHNLSAVLRTCDAVGILDVFAVAPARSVKPSGGIASGAHRWVGLRRHATIESAVDELQAEGLRLIAAHPSDQAVDFRDIDYTAPIAVLLGQELDGLSSAALEACDAHVVIPMAGLVQSLNVSVAAAVILYEAQRQREAAGMYDRPRLEKEVFDRRLFEWCQPRIAAYCRRRGVPYPAIDTDGEPIGWSARGRFDSEC